jgi:hypothetical protein
MPHSPHSAARWPEPLAQILLSLPFSWTPGASGLAKLVTPLKRYEFVPGGPPTALRLFKAVTSIVATLRLHRRPERVHPMNPVPSVTAAAVCSRGDSRAGELKLQMISEHDALINLRR